MKAYILKHSEAITISTLAVFAPIKEMIVVAALAVVVDLITGIIAAYKRGEKIKSSKMATTVSKLLVIQTAIIMSFLIQKFLIQDSFPLTSWVSGIIGIQQVYSILENLNSISGGKMFADLLNKLSSINAKPEFKEKERKD